MHITYDLKEFVDRVKWIREFEALARLGLTNCSVAGTFFPSEAEELLDFCAENPSYHIISVLEGLFVNRYDPKGGAFCLAEGDKDPNYGVNPTYAVEEAMERIMEMMGRGKRE